MKHKRFAHWLPAILWAAFIFYMSAHQSDELPLIPLNDKIIHLCVYSVLGFFAAKGIAQTHGYRGPALFVLGMVIAGFFGFTDEVHQSFVPMRSAEVLDLVMDFAGGFVGAFVYGIRLQTSKDN